MFLTQQDAVRIYARFCRARFGQTAKRSADRKAQSLKSKGDTEGCRVWADVAAEIGKQEHRRNAETPSGKPQ